MSARAVRYANPVGRVLYLVLGTIIPIVGLVASPLLGLVRYWGWGAAIGMVVFGTVCILVVLSFWQFTSIEIQPFRVVLRGLFHKTVIGASDVGRIEMDPPVRTLSMKWSFGGRWSTMTIHRRGLPSVDASGMPDGLKLRIANALRPDEFPLPEG